MNKAVIDKLNLWSTDHPSFREHILIAALRDALTGLHQAHKASLVLEVGDKDTALVLLEEVEISNNKIATRLGCE